MPYSERQPDIQPQAEIKEATSLIGEVTRPSEKHEDRNEDKTFIDQTKEMAGLFDGMGGGMAGEEASKLARDTVKNELSKVKEGASPAEWQRAIRQALGKTQEAVTKMGNRLFFEHLDDPFTEAAYRDLPQSEIQKLIIERGMSPTGTTASIMKMIERLDGGADLVYGHTGDSRIYVLRKNGTLEQITRDQGGLEEAVGTNLITREEADFIDQATSKEELLKKFGPDRGAKIAKLFGTFRRGVKNALGLAGNEFQIGTIRLEPGDLVIGTSDGIHDNLTSKEIRQEIMKGGTPAEISARLVEASRKRYSEGVLRSKPDDKTAITMEVAEAIEAEEITEEPEEEIVELGAEDIEELEAEDKIKSAEKIKKIKRAIGL